MQQIIRDIIEGISNSYGKHFFERITLALDKVIQSDYTFIARLDVQRNISKTICLVGKGKVLENFEYSLKNTPCANVADDSVCIYTDHVTDSFPDDQLLIDMGIEGYLGTPLYDSHGKVMGLIVALYEQPITDEEITLSLFELFSGRVAGELERLEHEQQLIGLNNSLDNQVNERTKKLAETIEQLKNAHEQLIESEKMAALGGLVSGVAHEVNTPLGVAITAQSLLQEKFLSFKNKLDSGGITRSDMASFMEQLGQSLPLMEHNLYRAKELIEDFKRTAKEQAEIKCENIDVANYYQRIVSTLTPILKRKKAKISLACEHARLATYPGYHAQILTSLVTNSVQHGFVSDENNEIEIIVKQIEPGRFSVDYKDNGKGISKDIIGKVTEPFFTTARASGATGLGLSICHNLASNALDGSFVIDANDKGTHIIYTFRHIP